MHAPIYCTHLLDCYMIVYLITRFGGIAQFSIWPHMGDKSAHRLSRCLFSGWWSDCILSAADAEDYQQLRAG